MKADLTDLLAKAKEAWEKMSEEERETMIREQVKGVAKAEASWPKPKKKWINGVLVYESYEDYCND